MADLEADVDDPDERLWEDLSDDEDKPNGEDLENDILYGVNIEHTRHTKGVEDGSPAPVPSKVLSIRSKAGSLPAEFASGPSASNIEGPNASPSQFVSNIISRRHVCRRASTHQPCDDESPSRSDETTRETSNLVHHIRPITPNPPNLHNVAVTPPNESPTVRAATPTAADLAGDGPMTPTNNAGPFVFDGSAGRAAGSRMAAGMVHETESPI